MRPTGIDFGVLGTLRMAVDDRVVSLGAPKQRAVFAMLLLGRGRPVSVDALIDELISAAAAKPEFVLAPAAKRSGDRAALSL